MCVYIYIYTYVSICVYMYMSSLDKCACLGVLMYLLEYSMGWYRPLSFVCKFRCKGLISKSSEPRRNSCRCPETLKEYINKKCADNPMKVYEVVQGSPVYYDRFLNRAANSRNSLDPPASKPWKPSNPTSLTSEAYEPSVRLNGCVLNGHS